MSSPNASSRWPKCASAKPSRAGAEEARRDTMPGGGGALAAVHSGQDQAVAGQHDGSALLQPGLTCTGRTARGEQRRYYRLALVVESGPTSTAATARHEHAATKR